ncbi:tetratricopeptide repeat protein [Rubinisphaera margarita]|uniref:tetratricopeptide repeat protein n=1 Tax=Rubinisphaera margarita TaxID=2909586 RepID=UPI001EE84BAC|nr:tetratricopeptide repeat protein [Rubinisphaera margarita]MCG6157548.1 tetratricopeptide repeat protein [Rubinisphaera margarita]
MNRLRIPCDICCLTAILPLFIVIAIAPSAHACLWDNDTLAQERARMPGVHEAVIGFFPVHSPAYDEWRIGDRLRRLDELSDDDPARLPLYDDLAVSYDRLERSREAIEIMERALAMDPDRYETLANLGTVLVHAGRLDEGLVPLRRALEINPDAHFGRERYQILVIDWARHSMTEDGWMPPEESFELYLSSVKNGQTVVEGADAESISYDDAREAIVGMLRFGRADSPILLAALGSLLERAVDGKPTQQRLAAYAYLTAAEGARETGWTYAAKYYTEQARDAIRMQENVPWEKLEENYRTERPQALELRALVAADEAQWIAAGEPVDERFQEKWLVDDLPVALQTVDHRAFTWAELGQLLFRIVTGIALLILVLYLLLHYSQRNLDNEKVKGEWKQAMDEQTTDRHP